MVATLAARFTLTLTVTIRIMGFTLTLTFVTTMTELMSTLTTTTRLLRRRSFGVVEGGLDDVNEDPSDDPFPDHCSGNATSPERTQSRCVDNYKTNPKHNKSNNNNHHNHNNNICW